MKAVAVVCLWVVCVIKTSDRRHENLSLSTIFIVLRWIVQSFWLNSHWPRQNLSAVHFLDISRNNPGKFVPKLDFRHFLSLVQKRQRGHWEHLVHVLYGETRIYMYIHVYTYTRMGGHVRCVGPAAGDSCVLCFIWHGDALSSSAHPPFSFLFTTSLFKPRAAACRASFAMGMPFP